MPDRIRVYHPETGEPFDLPVGKANELRLEKGWLAQPIDPDAEPAVKTIEPHKAEVSHDWREADDGILDYSSDEELDDDEFIDHLKAEE